MKRSIAFATMLLIVATTLAAQEQNVQIKLKEIGGALSMPGVAKLDLVIHIARKGRHAERDCRQSRSGATGLAV
jgi:hypothetical protein